jgi:hypothetical protein
MIEIHQSTFNPDELGWEVILSVVELLKSRTPWTPPYQELLDADERLFQSVVEGDDTNDTLDRWRGAEEEWRDLGASFGIAVYDDGEAGWTYVGTEEEINEFLEKQDADF